MRCLRRDRKHRMLGGVASGIAKTYGIDLALVRVLWILAAVAWIGIPAYIIAWIAIPSDDGTDDGEPYERRDFGMVLALALIGIGLLVALHQLVPSAWRFGRIGGPLLLIGAGVAILVMRRPGVDDEIEEPTESTTELVEPEPEAVAAAIATTTETSPTETTPEAPPTAWTQTQEWPTPPRRHDARDLRREARRERRRARPRPFLTPITLSVLLIGGGITGLLQASGALDVNITIALAIATLFVGAVLVLSSWVGRARGLILIGILLAGLTAASSAIDVPLRGGFGNRIYRPTSVDAIRPKYQLAAGRMVLDLRQLPATATPPTIVATVGFGELDVDVSTAQTVTVDAHAGAGNIEIFGIDSNGWHVSSHQVAPGSSTGTLNVDLKVGAGHILVRRYDGNIETFPGGTP
jgi:phage shock protein PspC (stress-responsive transcriptional regulator)